MVELNAYYDGNTIRLIDDYKLEKNQKFVIIINDGSEQSKADKIKSLMGCFSTGEKLSSEELTNRMKLENQAWAEAVEKKYENS
jgi:hypothetical protein